MPRITQEHIQDVYRKFKEYFELNKDDFFQKVPKHIVEDIKKIIKDENIFEWNDASLSDYINDLIYMLKGQQFARTINSFAEKYFIEKICQDFDTKSCINAKKSLKLHKEYYLNIINKKNDTKLNKDENYNMKTKNIMLYGAPGVGKTHNYKRLISMIENGDGEKMIFDTISQNATTNDFDNSTFETIKKEKRIEFVTFHQSYSYEDFIEGFRPQDNGNIKLEDGIFKKLCDDANKNSQKNFYMVIDEINRGNISKIFGELITLIEEDKRDSYEVTLPYSKEKFKIPSNLYIIATMNSTDKSIATIDIALRRRFTFLKMKPNEELVKNENAKVLMNKLNDHIEKTINEDYKLGHSYFMKIENEDDLAFVKEYKIKPLLEEYFYGDETNYKEAIKILGLENEQHNNL